MGSLSATAESTQFGKYNLVARLATGGMAEIFLARLQGVAGFEKLICIKRILPHLARDPQFVAMFLDEARIAARISHPNVCQVFELGEIEGSYYIAMEYLEGVPLASFRRAELGYPPPDPRLVAGIAVQACEALHHAHQLKNAAGVALDVVHRDVSPQNVFVTVDGVVKVLDFGIAKVQDASVKTTTGAIKGTYAYMSPEALRGERVDRRADVFAFAAVLWETLIGRHLFRRDTDFLTFQAITGDPIEDVAALRPEVPAAMSDVIRTALSRDREGRFPTARMFGEALAAAVPPASGSAISEYVVHAFPVELSAQARLIRIAREGGFVPFELDRAPSAVPADHARTTPVSKQHHQLVAALAHTMPSVSGSGAVIAPPWSGAITGTGPVAGTGPGVGTGPGIGTGPGSAGSMSWVAQPSPGTPERSGLRRPLVIAALALALGGVSAFLYARVSAPPAVAAEVPQELPRPPASPAPPPPPAPTPPAPTPASTEPPAAAPPTLVPSTPTPIPSTPTPASAAPRPALSTKPAGTPSAPPAKPPRPAEPAAAAARPSGAPGFITIDSSPVYATVSIDGKDYGETPLVNLSLPSGRHRVRAVSPSGATRAFAIQIEPGKTAPVYRITW